MPAGRSLHREGLVAERRHRPSAPRRDVEPALAARRDHRRVRLVHLRPRLAGGVRGARSSSSTVGEEHDRDLVLRKLDRHPVRAQRHAARPRPLPREGRRDRDPAGALGDGVPRLASSATRSSRSRTSTRSPARCSRSSTTSPSSRRRSTSRRSRRSSAPSIEIRHELEEQVKHVRGEGDAARGAPHPAAHRVRPRDDAGARLLQRDRELLADPRRAARRARRRTRCSTTSRPTSSSSSTSRTRPSRRSAACTRATARASRRSSTTASGCRQRSTTGRCASTSSSRRCRRSCSSRRRPGAWELRQSTRVAEQLIRPTVPRRSRGRAAPDEEPDRRPAERDPPARGGGRARRS